MHHPMNYKKFWFYCCQKIQTVGFRCSSLLMWYELNLNALKNLPGRTESSLKQFLIPVGYLKSQAVVTALTSFDMRWPYASSSSSSSLFALTHAALVLRSAGRHERHACWKEVQGITRSLVFLCNYSSVLFTIHSLENKITLFLLHHDIYFLDRS